MPEKNRVISLFKTLMAFDSPSLGERAICDFLKKKFISLGLLVEEDDAGEKIGGTSGNIYAQLQGTYDAPPLLFCAHMDTVAPALNKQAVLRKDGRITSAGDTVLGADDCSGIAAILEALTEIQSQNLPHRPIEILLTVAEELYCLGVQRFDYTKIKSKEAYVLDLTGPVGGVAYQAPAILSFSVIVSGRAAHAGFAPQDGVHAIWIAAKAVSELQLGKIDDATVNIGTIHGGNADNIVPEECRLTGEIRSYTDEKAMEWLNRIEAVFRAVADGFGASVQVDSDFKCRAYRTDPEHPVVKRFQRVCESNGVQMQLCQTFGGSDNNHLTRHGIQGVVLATAMNQCHSCEEYTEVNELVLAAELTMALMLAKEGAT